MECLNHNNIAPTSSPTVPQQTVVKGRQECQQLREKISSMFLEFLTFLENESKYIPTTSSHENFFSTHKKAVCDVLKWEWSYTSSLFNDHCEEISILELLHGRIQALVKSAIVKQPHGIGLINSENKEILIEMIPIVRDKQVSLAPTGVVITHFFEESSKCQEFQAVADQYGEKIRVIKKNSQQAYYQIGENEDINEGNTNLTFDPQLLKEIPEDKRNILLRYLKPHMYTPDDHAIGFTTANKKLYLLSRRPAVEMTMKAICIYEKYKELNANFYETYKVVTQTADKDYELKFKEKVNAEKIYLELTKYIKLLKKQGPTAESEISIAKTNKVIIVLFYITIQRQRNPSTAIYIKANPHM